QRSKGAEQEAWFIYFTSLSFVAEVFTSLRGNYG
ncbi:MAG: hypothetical protein ACI9G6_002300, partial [Limisphaerales bacterium]